MTRRRPPAAPQSVTPVITNYWQVRSAAAVMTKSRTIAPQEWIPDYFSPVISVLSSPDCDRLVGKNNLTLTELLQPFTKLLTEVTLKDPEGHNHGLPAFSVTLQDFKKDPTRLINQKLMLDLVDGCTDEPSVTRTFPNGQTLEAPGFTPWFDVWTKLFVHSIPAVEHEYLRHHLGCVFAISSTCEAPLGQIQALVDQQYKHQHDKPHAYPQFTAPQSLKYYLLVHDVYEATEAQAQAVLVQMQEALGSANCHLLQINSRKTQREAPNPALVDYWLGPGHRFCNIDARREGVGPTIITTGVTMPVDPMEEKAGREEGEKAEPMAHPLAQSEKPDSPIPPVVTAPASQLKPVNTGNIAQLLTSNDIDRIRILVREFCIKGLIPHAERQMRQLSEIVTNRKSRSLFSGAKRWFGQNKPGTTGGTSVVYSKEAPELQMRKLGDLYFMFKLYKQAYNCYHSVKKDFQSDEAWNYYAGVAEMCALSQFMQNDPTKKYPSHYMEDSINKYLQVCQMPEFAVRATLFDALCLKFQGLFLEAAGSYIRLTNETKDLRSSLLLEQAAYCYLLASPPSIRKYAFHIILSGYRFSKSGQKRHSSRAYRQGFQIYQGQGWGLSEDHILYTLGHQSLLLKDYVTASQLFNQLLLMPQDYLPSLQQMCHLREFFIVHHMKEKETKHQSAEITIPKFQIQDCVLDLSQAGETYDRLSEANPKDSFQRMERVFLERISGHEVMFLARTCQSVFSPVSYVNLVPQSVVGEPIRFMVPVSNPFLTTLLLKKIHLLWRFSPDDQSESISNDKSSSSNAEDVVKTELLDSITLEKGKPCIVDLKVTALQPGDLYITGVEYGLKAQFPQSEATDYIIRGRQYFTVKGPRLSLTKEHKTKVVYGPDHRLQVAIRPGQPRLEMSLDLPKSIHQGEIRILKFTLKNTGLEPMANLYLVSQNPGMFSFGKAGKAQSSLFECPVIQDSALKVLNDNGQSVEQPLDFLPVPVKKSRVEAGQVETLELWIRGPDNLALHSFKLFVYYENPKHMPSPNTKSKAKAVYRILRREAEIKILPAIVVSAEKNPVCMFESQTSDSILLHVSNISKDLSRNLDQIQIHHISIVSHDYELLEFQSLSEDRFVKRGDSISIGLKTAIKSSSLQKSSSASGGSKDLLFSSMGGKGAGRLQHAPYLDFLKPAFQFGPTVQAPKLDEDQLVIFWEGNGQIQGQTMAPIKPMKLIESGLEDHVDSPRSTTSPLSMRSKYPCELKLEVEPRIEHSFQKYHLAMMPCRIRIHNPNPYPGDPNTLVS
ncbi:trafficking protein particle complex subunit 8-like [Tigriopus californicus]|uniref:trafficking protein particle complex subunit 8-like n=1 Tax=Tigriopus californicus TaxID=6832 RepID=UPI0027DA2122|nr:trafficking protein particle complex subunit 8-like [Tigriopus californicus]|eukprot:TCALIF_09195-PA protein Name:"Similar to TRAPPC8 Trafficking protein particle complex subunit 8 (Homo sapiens)" AED:0.03 eAED:0.04 QI:86/1/0.75/1/0.66/0.75/4/0/1282